MYIKYFSKFSYACVNMTIFSSDPKSNMTQLRLNMTKEVAHGIQGFFDAFVGNHLLYNQEKVI